MRNSALSFGAEPAITGMHQELLVFIGKNPLLSFFPVACSCVSVDISFEQKAGACAQIDGPCPL